MVVPTKRNVPNDIKLDIVSRVPEATVLSMRLTRYAIRQYQAFNLLTEEGETLKDVPVTHIKKKITIIMLTERVLLPTEGLPYEFYSLIRINEYGQFLPIIQQDFLQTHASDLEPVNIDTYNTTITIKYNPCSSGWLRFVLQVENALEHLLKMGFTNKDIDEVKRVFSETNVYLLCATMLIGSIHVRLNYIKCFNL